MEIPGVPESVPRARVVELVEALGLDIRDLRSFSVTVHAIEAEVFARDENGHIYADGKNAALHQVAIPITDSPDAADLGRSFVKAVQEYEGRG